MYYYKANAWRQVFVEIEAIACDLAQRKSANYADGSSRFLCARHGGQMGLGLGVLLFIVDFANFIG